MAGGERVLHAGRSGQRGPVMETMTLKCACGQSATYGRDDASQRRAYDDGWRLDEKNKNLCPDCSAKRARRVRREHVRKYGEAAVARAERDVARLLGEKP